MTRRDYERLELAILRAKGRISSEDIKFAFEILCEEIARITLDDQEIE